MYAQSTASDEVSLVDLTVLLVERWKIMLAIFLVVTLATTAYALTRPSIYSYTSLYHIAEKYLPDEETLPGLEPPNAVLTQLQLLVIPSVTRAFLAEQGLESMPFRVNVSQPSDDDQLIFLRSDATKAQAEHVEILHREILENIQSLQAARVERLRKSLEMRLASAEAAMATAVGDDALRAARSIIELEPQLAGLEQGEVTQLAEGSLEPVGISKELIVALGVIIGAILAVIGVFVLHFASLVRRRLREEC